MRASGSPAQTWSFRRSALRLEVVPLGASRHGEARIRRFSIQNRQYVLRCLHRNASHGLASRAADMRSYDDVWQTPKRATLIRRFLRKCIDARPRNAPRLEGHEHRIFVDAATTVGDGSSDTDANVLPSVQFEAPPTRSASTAQSAKVTGSGSGALCASGTLSPVVTSRHVSQQHVAKRSRESASTRADALRLRIGLSFDVVVGIT